MRRMGSALSRRRSATLTSGILLVLAVAAALVHAGDKDKKGSSPPASQPSGGTESDSWNEVGFSEDKFPGTWQTRIYQFKVGSPHWRITVETENPDGAANAQLRISLEEEGTRDPRNGTPNTWKPFVKLFEGKPGGTGTKELEQGVMKDGSAKHFRLLMSGMNAKYHVTVEDQSPSGSSSKAKRGAQPKPAKAGRAK